MRFFSLFPAYAGVILAVLIRIFQRSTFPRIRGGDPRVMDCLQGIHVFSPHTRG